MLGAHSLCHRRPWKQDIVEEQLIEPRVMRQSDAREWIQIALLQPVDVRTKYVKVPVVKFVDKYVPKIMYHENTIEVPRIVHKTVQKFVEKPYIKYVDKYEEVPEIRYKYTYVPKETIQERSVYKPRFTVVEKVKYKEKRQVKFVDRYVEIPEREVALQCEAGIFPENNQLVDHVVQGEEAAESSTSREVRLLPSEDNDTSGEEERKSDQDVTSSDLSNTLRSRLRGYPS
ncbi:alveolin domain containing intermediate filament IMC1 [Besnoitia besnoiti]|uniref:Alveolin domain containing intermediate filament IMC1 n=1 Tax=Besnoitia besnoiti TaxID=94643 RepID=A0A2A9MCD9_BESBE|nr:alveolin domain containing intermediate filament IMC1 [Besnoitia besnoiti]PFH33060.1 alveolin domain containing intermediate filament IMC1 [Besnoitia besnoiti]